MLTAEQVEVKNRTIGGSDIAALFGESPWAQPMDVWLRVTGRRPIVPESDPDPDSPLTLGSELEAVISRRYTAHLCDLLGHDVRVIKHHKPRFHPSLPYVAGNVDAQVVGANHKRLGELKLCLYADREQWGEQGTDEIPVHYLLQVAFYLWLMDHEIGDLFAWFGRNDWRRYEVVREKRLDDLIAERVQTFWTDHVETDVPPELIYSHSSSDRALRDLYPGTNGERIVLPSEAVHYHAVLKDLQGRARQVDSAIAEMKARLREMVGENAVGLLPGGGGYARKVVKRKGYFVDDTEYEMFTFSPNYKPKDD